MKSKNFYWLALLGIIFMLSCTKKEHKERNIYNYSGILNVSVDSMAQGACNTFLDTADATLRMIQQYEKVEFILLKNNEKIFQEEFDVSANNHYQKNKGGTLTQITITGNEATYYEQYTAPSGFCGSKTLEFRGSR